MIKLSIIVVLLVVIELVYFKVADRFNIIDKPNMRSSHSHITLRGGGIIFLAGAWLWAVFYGFSSGEGLPYPWFMTGLTLISLVSFADDVRPVPNKVRLVVQFLSMFLMFQQLGILHLNLWWAVLIALIVCVGIINAYNFMDGINGITGGYSLAVLLPLMVVYGIPDQVGYDLSKTGYDWGLSCPACPGISSFLMVMTLSVLVFCLFNFRKRARCFAGDVGAVSIAFILTFAIGKLIVQTGDFSYIVFLGVYGVDSVLTIVHRIMLGESLGVAHRKHAYQIMANELKMPHTMVSSIYMLIQLAVSAGLIFLPVNHYLYAAVVLALLGLAYIIFMKKYYHLHAEYLESLTK